jgi:hypothetical protein
MNAEAPDVVAELESFLASVKVAETISDSLRDAISVETGLEDAIRAAVAAGKDVVVAGSAGGGKTHLLHALDGHFAVFQWPDNEPPDDDPCVATVPDATVVFDQIEAGGLDAVPDRARRVIAINEGPLLALARSRPESFLARSVPLLHNAQRGIISPHDDLDPVVIDVGGYDPIENRVVERLLALPALKQLVLRSRCSCDDPAVCPRKVAWLQLDLDEIRMRVNDVLRLANVLGRSILFRDLWDFVGDVALGGSCEADPPTSPWFWRVFAGESVLADRLRTIADPSLVVYPRAEAHIWWGDWNSEEIQLLDGVEPVPLVVDPPFVGERHHWLKAQLFFIVHAQSILSIIRDQVNLEMLASLDENKVAEVVETLNYYMAYGTQRALRQRLDLWLDMGVERRMDRARGQASLGQVAASDLNIVRSSAVANHPDSSVAIPGSRFFFVHDGSGASLSLTPETLNLLKGGRSFRISDRPHTDMEWQIADFYAAIARAYDNSERLGVLELEFDAMSSSARKYLISAETGHVELEEG